MELRVLRYFLGVAREESMTGAARRLHVTQPTLSRQLQDLEEELGQILFLRKPFRDTDPGGDAASEAGGRDSGDGAEDEIGI